MIIKAVFFDVFGTLVDWRGSISRDAAALLASIGQEIDAAAFADAWRAEYQPAMAGIREGARGFIKLDHLHRENLERILPRFGLGGISEETRRALTFLWHRLDAWPDVTPALARLRRSHLLAPMSNGNISLMVDLARHNDFRWDAILGAEMAQDYKPSPAVYRAGVAAFDLQPEECLMVAAHSSDLAAARACGLRTAHIARPDEHGPGLGESRPSVPVDLAARDLEDLAKTLVVPVVG